jgi:predicted lipoprotein with Yx(FWY)xxD motif
MAVAIVLVLGTGGAVAAVAATAPTKPATVKTRSVKLGKILVNGSSQTLYLFEKDKKGKSACSGACAKAWPPLLTKGKPKASGSVSAAKLGTTKRADGRTQVTYNGHPLYTFIMDHKKPGSTAGQGIDAFGAEWYVVGTNGKKIEKKGDKSSTSSQSQPQPGGYGGSGY